MLWAGERGLGVVEGRVQRAVLFQQQLEGREGPPVPLQEGVEDAVDTGARAATASRAGSSRRRSGSGSWPRRAWGPPGGARLPRAAPPRRTDSRGPGPPTRRARWPRARSAPRGRPARAQRLEPSAHPVQQGPRRRQLREAHPHPGAPPVLAEPDAHEEVVVAGHVLEEQRVGGQQHRGQRSPGLLREAPDREPPGLRHLPLHRLARARGALPPGRVEGKVEHGRRRLRRVRRGALRGRGREGRRWLGQAARAGLQHVMGHGRTSCCERPTPPGCITGRQAPDKGLPCGKAWMATCRVGKGSWANLVPRVGRTSPHRGS